MSQKLDAVRAALSGTKVECDHFLTKFTELCGVTEAAAISDEDFAAARFEDLEECGLPRILARRVARIMRGDEDEGNKTTVPQKVVIDVSSDPEKHAATLSPVQLVEHYDADNHTNPYGKRLKEVTEGRKCIVFNTDGTLNVDISKQLVDELVNLSYPERDTVNLDDGPAQVYPVGARPDRYANENPAQPGQPLYQNGESEVGCQWGDLPLNVRQLVHICVRHGECDLNEGDLFEKVEGKTFGDLCKQPRFREAAVEFKEMEKLGTLPQLKIVLGKSGKPRANDPFSGGNRVW
jgi:hypothetical protein